MSWTRFRRIISIVVLALGASAAGVVATGQRVSASQSGAGDCTAHHPNGNAEYPVWYAAGCTGHDEPELDPVSSHPPS